MTRLLLIHGGLWEDMGATRFWGDSGVLHAFRQRGHSVSAPDRLWRARSWVAEADYIAAMLPPGATTIVSGSNGCSVALRYALLRPERVKRLVLAWPATAGDPEVDADIRGRLQQLGAESTTIDRLLAGGTLRGVSDAELRGLSIDVAVLPAAPEDRFHQHKTSRRLCEVLTRGTELPGSPVPMARDFSLHLPSFIDAIEQFAHAPVRSYGASAR